MNTLKVAGITVNIESGDKAFFSKRYEKYYCEHDEKTDMTIKTIVTGHIPEPCGELLLQIKRTCVVRLSDGWLCRYVKSPAGSVPFAICFNEDYSDSVIEIARDCPIEDLTATDIEYMFTGFLFANRLTYLKGTILHGSAIAYHDKGIVFSAPSGTGKSTHTGLWKEKYGDDVMIINDDKPAIRFEDDTAYIYGTPWSGKTALNINTRVALSAIVFLERSKENRIEQLGVSEGVLHCIRQLPNPFYDKKIGNMSVDFIRRLYEGNVPMYRLYCNKSEEAVDTVYDEIIRGGAL